MEWRVQKSAQVAQKVQEPRSKLRVTTSSPSSFLTLVWVMAPPAQTRSHMLQLMQVSGWKTMRPR